MSDQTAMAEPAVASETVVVEPEPEPQETDTEPTLHLRLVRPPDPRHVAWQPGTVDNEHMGKKKSKCCCVYRKPKKFGESSSDEEDECKACLGHRKRKPGHGHDHASEHGAHHCGSGQGAPQGDKSG